MQSPLLDQAAALLGATSRQVALARLLQRSPNILIIAGTSATICRLQHYGFPQKPLRSSKGLALIPQTRNEESFCCSSDISNGMHP